MQTLVLNIPGKTPIPLAGEGQSWTLGRSSQNDVSIPDPSLSRHHARITLREGTAYLEDLGSLNGTCLNGAPVSAPQPLRDEDVILLGHVALHVGTHSRAVRVRIDAEGDVSTHGSMVIPLTEPGPTPSGEPAETHHLRATIREIQALSLELLADSPPDELFSLLLACLWTLLDPWRAAVLLLDAKGGLVTAASRISGEDRPILLSRGLVDAAIHRKESLLYRGWGTEADLDSDSILRSGITSAIVTPLEHQGVVKGLLYLDSRPPHRGFDEEALRLASTLAHLATAKLEQARVREEAQARKKVDQELHLARQIQQGLLPGFPPEIEGFEVLGNNLPSRQVSGDLFGWWQRSDGKWLFCLADVSGKGLGPGLLMASLQATLEAWTDLDLPVGELALRLSGTLCRHTDGRRFVTAFLALLDPGSGTLTYTNAGHNPALLIHPDGRSEALGSHGLPLAMLPDNRYGETRLDLAPGALVAMYTDGITETESPDGEEFGVETLTRFLVERRGDPLMALDAMLMEALDRFSQGAPYLDDRTLLLLRRNPR
jgi:serine phosphatase RsbU (regulator of sigma subunit)